LEKCIFFFDTNPPGSIYVFSFKPLFSSLSVVGLKDDKAKSDLLPSYQTLNDRPDYDGHITLDDANKWFREGNWKPLYVDLAEIDLSAINKQTFKSW
jgi:hypothetical protein